MICTQLCPGHLNVCVEDSSLRSEEIVEKSQTSPFNMIIKSYYCYYYYCYCYYYYFYYYYYYNLVAAETFYKQHLNHNKPGCHHYHCVCRSHFTKPLLPQCEVGTSDSMPAAACHTMQGVNSGTIYLKMTNCSFSPLLSLAYAVVVCWLLNVPATG